MKDRDYERRGQFHDSTAKEALKKRVVEEYPPVTNFLEPINFGPHEYRLRAKALSTLNGIFPNEEERRPSKQNRQYRYALDQIALGNFSIVDKFKKPKGGV